MGENGPQSDWSVKDVFTTGEAAEVCRVSQQTIIRCFDSGRLTGFKVPGSKFRRIPRDELLRFMRTNNIPTDSINGGPVVRVLVICADGRLHEAARSAVDQDAFMKDRAGVSMVSTALDAGIEAASNLPGVVIISSDVPGIEMGAAVRRMLLLEHKPDVICAVQHANESVAQSLRDQGAAAVVALGDRRDTLGTVLLTVLRSRVSENGH